MRAFVENAREMVAGENWPEETEFTKLTIFTWSSILKP